MLSTTSVPMSSVTVDRAVVVAHQQRPSIERDAVDRVAVDGAERIGIDVTADEGADIAAVGEGRVVRDLEGERDRVR